MSAGASRSQQRGARFWPIVGHGTTFLAVTAVGFALTGCLILNGARPPVDPLSWPSWTAWWAQDPRSAVSLIVTSAIGVFGLVGTYFQIFLSRGSREVEQRTLARIEAGEKEVKAVVLDDGSATRSAVGDLDAHVRAALARLEAEGGLALARAAGLNDQQLLAIAQSLGFANVPTEQWAAELLQAPRRLADAGEGQSKAVQLAIDEGRLEDAGRLMSNVETASRDAAARSAAGLGALRLAQARFLEAADHYGRAAVLIAGIDRHKAWRCRFAQAFALAEHGRLFPGLDQLRGAVRVLWSDALPLAPREAAPADWAITHANLGSVLTALGERVGGAAGIEALEEAVRFFHLALEVRTREAMLIEWAKTQANLGDTLRALGDLSSGAGAIKTLDEAVAACRAALQVFSPQETPSEWATAQIALGNALHALAGRLEGKGKIESLKEASHAYLSALEVCDLATMPATYAMAQNNLGLVLITFGELTGGPLGIASLQQAVIAERAALDVYRPDTSPADWAMSQNNLGAALRALGELAGGEAEVMALKEAEIAFRAALEVHTPERAPAAWRSVQANLSAILARLEALGHGGGEPGDRA